MMRGPIMRAPRSRRRGFTLVEVLASLALVAIILPVAMKGVSMSVQAAALAKERSEAASLAQSKLAEIVATGALNESNSEGDFPDYPDYRWQAAVAEWESTTLQQVEVSVLWDSRGQERSVTLDTLVYTGGQ